MEHDRLEGEGCALSEPVRLVIWDLDETFWKGVLTEGGIELIPRHCELIRTLARRGIISSICSKNDHDAVARILNDGAMWDYFVMPSVNWEAKGPRLQALIESLQLRPASVIFIDDNHLNREEARHFLPDLQISDPSVIPRITTLSHFEGKDDRDMTRLRQYKLLEQRKAEKQAVNGETAEFLRRCNIVVEIEHDITQHLDRAIELINRTNQLNFVKSRLPEDLEQAKRELSTLLAGHDIQAGLVRVIDRYGDHGYCGIYVMKAARFLLQFAFSCRILGMGIEQWLYQRLGRPQLNVSGEVLSDVIHSTNPIDWIQISTSAGSEKRTTRKPAAWIAARGGCDLQAIFHYFNVGTFGSGGEFNLYRNGCDVRIDHSMFLRYAITGLPAGGIEACKRLGYREEDFRTTLLNHRTGQGFWLLSFWSDAVFAIYRHRETGVTVPFMLTNWYDQARDVTKASVDNLLDDENHDWFAASLDYLKHNFDYLGLISEELFKQNLRLILNSAPRHTRIVILGANEHLWDPKANVRHQSPLYESLNRWSRAVARWRRNVTILKVRDFIESDAEVHNWGHFDRMVYFRIYQEIERRILR
jgi:FkbH-like protein